MLFPTWLFIGNFKNTVGRAEHQFHSSCSIGSHMSYGIIDLLLVLTDL